MRCRLLLLLVLLPSLSGCCGIWYSRHSCDAGETRRVPAPGPQPPGLHRATA